MLLCQVAMLLLHITDADYGRNLDNGTPTRSSLDTRNVSQAVDLWHERMTILDAVCLMAVEGAYVDIVAERNAVVVHRSCRGADCRDRRAEARKRSARMPRSVELRVTSSRSGSRTVRLG